MKNACSRALRAFTAFAVALAGGFSAPAQAAESVTIGYQGICNPWKSKIVAGEFEKQTGYEIEWRKFDSGSASINAMASGDVHISVAGSSPIAAGVSGAGLDVQLFWILEDIAAAEALVVRDGAGIDAPQDLRGKTIGVPFVSTTHFHLLFALEQFGIEPEEVKILNMQPNAIASAWEGGQIDAAFVWDPALGRIKQSGKVLVTSGQLSAWGKATFDGMIVDRAWAQSNKDFMAKFVKIISDADADYRDNPNSWTPSSDKVQAAVKLAGCNANDVPGILALFGFPTLDEQASSAWLGGGANGGAARALRFTSEFLKSEKKVQTVHRDYSKFVTDEYARAAKRL